MNLKTLPSTALTCVLLLGAPALSRADVLVSENFDSYADGSLNGQNGGTGFSNAWNSSVNVGGGIVAGNDPSFRSFTAHTFGNSGTRWLSFDWGFASKPTENGSYGGLTFYAGGGERFLIGNTWPGSGHDLWRMSGSGATAELNHPGMKTAVAKITLGAGSSSTVELWIGPTGTPVDVNGPALITVTSANLEGVDGIRIMGRDFGGGSNQAFDNLLIGTTAADVDAFYTPPAAITATWTNPAGGDWSTAGNWLDELAGNGSGNIADFSTLNLTADTTVHLDSPRTIGNLIFGDTDTSSPAGWTLGNNANAGNILTLAGTTPTLTVNALGGTKTATIRAVVAGSAGLAKTGPGTLTLTATNTYSGTTAISAGTLQIGNGGTTGTLGTGPVSIASVASLTINRSDDYSPSAGLSISGAGSLLKTGSGILSLSSNSNIYSGGTTISGGTLRAVRSSLGTGAVVVNNGGTLNLNDQWVLCGPNPYNVTESNIGTLTINAGGTLQLDALQGFANGVPNLILNGGLVTGGPDDFRGDLFLWNGNQQITAGGAATSTVASIIGVTGNNNTITVNADSTLNLTGGIKNSDWYSNGSSPGGFIKAGPGTLNLTGSSSYSGDSVITGGTLKMQNPSFSTTPRAYGVATGAVLNIDGETNVASGTTTFSGTGTLRITGGNLSNPNGPGRNLNFALGSGAVLDIQAGAGIVNGGWQSMTWTSNLADLNVNGSLDLWDGQSVLADALTGSGSISKTHGGNSPTMLTVGLDNGGGTFSGTISNAAGQIAFTKEGSGTQVLTGSNTYTGTTTINAGTLQIGDGGTSGTLGSGPLTLASGASLIINRGDDYSLSAGQSISGTGTLIKNGSGTLTLPRAATFTGTLTLNAGTLKASDHQAFGASGTTFALNDGSIHLNGYSQTLAAVTGSASSGIQGGTGLMSILTLGSENTSSSYGGSLAGNLALVKVGTGTLTLSGALTMNGIITVQEGTLDLSTATLAPGTRINASKLATVKLPTAPISKLYIDNVKLSPGRWGSPGSVAAGLADFESPAFNGPGVVTIANTGPSCMERWKTMKHGFFVHYVWDGTFGSMRPDGSKPTSINETADSFDVPGFANDMEAMGVEYVIFTAWQANFFPLYPSSAMAKYHSGRTPNRDMIGDMITAVRAKGIRVLLYTHPYQPIKYLGTFPNQVADLEWNDNLINDVYAELVERYGDQIDGLFLDENFVGGNQDEYVDYPRLLDTIRRRNPELVLMHNWNENIYICDMMHRETPAFYYTDLKANPDATWTTSVPTTQLVAPGWGATVPVVPSPSTNTVTRSAAGIFRTAVVGAGSCTLGGGWIWGAGPYAGTGFWPENSQTFVGRWEKGVLEAMQGAAALIAPVAVSIKNTYPSTSWLTAPETSIPALPQGIVATRSTDDTKEYIHVLNPPAGTKTLRLPPPADGKVFTNARLLKNNRAVTLARNARGITLTLGASDNWETLDTVIVMDVASPGARSLINNNDPAATYTGAWTYGSGRATTEYGQDIHETSTNGNFLEFVFQGTEIELIGTCASNRGTADVYLDNVFQQTIDLYSASTIYRKSVFAKSGMPRGTHTLKVVKTGGTLLTIDAFQVTEVINSNDPILSYSGAWSSKSSANAIGGEVRETNNNFDTLSFNFEGNGIDAIGSKGVGGGTVRFSLNDAYSLSVPQSSNFSQSQALVFTNSNTQTLTQGSNKLTVLKLRGTWADVDAFRIYKGSSSTSPALQWGNNGNGGNGTWNIDNSANWYDGSANVRWLDFGGNDYAAIFGGTAGTVTLASSINVSRLTFNTAGYTVSSNALNLNGYPATITTPTGTTTINSVIAGATSWNKAGPGTLRLTNAANTNTGNTSINEGTLTLTGTARLYSNLGWQSRTVSVNNGAILEVDRWDGNGSLGQLDYSSGNLVINGGTIRFTGNSNQTAEGQGFTIGAAGATLQSNAPANQTWNINLDTRWWAGSYVISSPSGGTLNLTGTGNGLISKVIPGSGGITKSGAGTWSLTNANSYTGTTTVNGGTLRLGNGSSNSSLANSSDVVVTSGALNLNYSGTDTIDELWLGGVQQVPGVYSAANSSGFITGAGTLTVTNGPPADPLLAWIEANWPTLADKTPGGDPDRDGIPNLLEYVLQGGNPAVSNATILPTSVATGTNFSFIYFRRTAATGTTQTFQHGSTLGSWTDIAIPGGAGVVIADQGGGIERVEITVPKGSHSALFGRLRVLK